MINLDLKGQVALVTGASRGIGRSIAMALGKWGARIIGVARQEAPLVDVCSEIVRQGGEAEAVAADISREEEIARVFQVIDEKCGGRLDVLVNNAGVGMFGPVKDYSAAQWDQTMAVNGRGTFLCCREGVRRMLPVKRGYIINIASVVGFKGYVNQAAYTASKHAMVGLTKTLAAEMQPHNIKVTVICPGGVETGMVGQARPDLAEVELLQPEDVTHTVLYLLSLPERACVDMIYLRRRTSKPF